MNTKPLKKLKILANDPNIHAKLNQVQDNVEASIHALNANPIATGRWLGNVVLVSGSTNFVDHGLGRNFQGVLAGLSSVASAGITISTTQTNPGKWIELDCTSSTTIGLYVF